MKYYLKLIRVPNLFFLALTQYLMWQIAGVFILQVYSGAFPLVSFIRGYTGIELNLLILATVFITAGGYVINDYFDTKIDAINRPEKMIVGKIIAKENAMRFYQILTAIGVVCGLLLSYMARSTTLAFIFLVVPGLLWFYSSNYKRMFMLGNLVVSFCASLSVLIVAIAKVAFLQNINNPEFAEILQHRYDFLLLPQTIYTWIGGFALFAFVLTWIREIIKDMEDEKGDREVECRTMPIKWGIKNTKIFLYVLISLTIIALFLVGNFYIPFDGMLSVRYIIFAVIAPLVVLIYMIFKANTPADFRQASILSKIIMLMGVLYSLVFWYLF
jgi:4-hydroxybenzoate polyprenyltransferase